MSKPVIGRLQAEQDPPLPPLRPILEAPIVNADEKSIYTVLKDLVLDADRRAAFDRASREFALAWHADDTCAARFEMVIERIRAGLPPETPDLYPASRPYAIRRFTPSCTDDAHGLSGGCEWALNPRCDQ
jgi:hypothetical protein